MRRVDPAVSTQALAATEIPFWHSMEGELGKEVDSRRIASTSRTATSRLCRFIKATTNRAGGGHRRYRSGKAPAILQVYEVGTATMMASKAIKPVYEVFKEAGINFDESVFVPTVAGYYTDNKSGHLLSQPFNSSTPMLYYNKDAFKRPA